MTLRALKRAIALRNPKPGLLFHSDRGIEYSAYGYQAFLRSRGIVPSMNRPRNCQDNSHMESFFHSLKAELVHQHRFTSDAQLNGQLGSVHSDRWKGTAAELANCNMIAVYPIVGWWRERHHLNRWNKRARYALIVTIQTPSEEIDIYTPVATEIEAVVPVEISPFEE